MTRSENIEAPSAPVTRPIDQAAVDGPSQSSAALAASSQIQPEQPQIGVASSASSPTQPAHEVLSQTQAAPQNPESSRSLRRSSRNAKSDDVSAAAATNVSPGQVLSSDLKPSNPRKRKSADSGSDNAELAPKRKCAARNAKEATAQKQDITWDKDKELWPEYDKHNPVYYANDGVTQYRPGENEGSPESRSPKKPPRGGARGGRGGAHPDGGGRKGKSKGKGGRGGSADPPERRQPLTQEEKAMVALLKSRQQELKRFFSTVGAQQVDILEQMANRDLNRLAKKANAHKKIPEYEEAVEELQAAMEEAEDLARTRHAIQLEAEMQRVEAEKEVMEQQFKVRPYLLTS